MSTIKLNPAYSEEFKTRLNALDEDTRAVFLGEPVKEHPDYDRSVWCTLRENKTSGERILFVRNHVDWFRAENPTGIVVTDPPVFAGKALSIEARVYMSLDDAAANRFVARTQYNTYISGEVDLNTACTRAKNRALRDLGYDIPRDAHEIQGWTPTEIVEGTSEKEYFDGGITIGQIPVPNGVPAIPVEAPAPAAPAAEKKEESAPAEVPAEKEAPVVAAPAEPADADKHTDAKKPKKRRTVHAEPVEPVEAPAEEAAPAEEKAPVEEKAPIEENVPEQNMTAEERAHKRFPTVAEAEQFSCRSLNSRTVGEQPNTRVAFFAKKVLGGASIAEPDLGLACLVVALNRGLKLR